MSNVVLKAENISKQYRLGQLGTGTISHDLNRFFAKLRGKEDPYLKVGEANDRSKVGGSDYVWSLKDINFEVKQGEVLGIIGKNGAGKSTLLKILSQVTTPTTGQVSVKGRIAALLEVGTGFHPDLSGRENIFLNGAILGMTKAEIKSKFDEIIEFSGVAKYIDTPVKRYSSGMMVRLGFAVAAHLEPEILIVDEVLAVGDAEFQKKCMGKMKDVSEEGRTVLFVSHNLSSIKQLCNRGILLVNGKLEFAGNQNETVDKYLAGNQLTEVTNRFEKRKLENKDLQLVKAELVDSQGKLREQFEISEDIFVNITIHCNKKVPNVYGYIVVQSNSEEVFIESDTFDILPNCLDDIKVGENIFKIKIPHYVLAFGEYFFYLSFASNYANGFLVDVPGNVLKINIIDTETNRGHTRVSKTSQLLNWEVIK
jgi:lipopolysaccharide transport system ATP-binding protein